jgi:hypothetical protein
MAQSSRMYVTLALQQAAAGPVRPRPPAAPAVPPARGRRPSTRAELAAMDREQLRQAAAEGDQSAEWLLQTILSCELGERR